MAFSNLGHNMDNLFTIVMEIPSFSPKIAFVFTSNLNSSFSKPQEYDVEVERERNVEEAVVIKEKKEEHGSGLKM